VSFLNPPALLGLLLVPLGLGAWLWLRRRRPPAAVPFPDVDLVVAAAGRPRLRRFVPLTLLVLALLGFGFALARPQVTTAVPREQATIVLAIDVSGSMAASDVEPYRLRAAQDAAKRFAETVPAQFQIGLITFSGEALLLVPPTTDRVVLNTAVDSLVADGATAIGDAVVTSLDAIELVQPGLTKFRSARILLLSDGANTVGVSPESAAARARAADVPVYTVALGTPDGVLPDGRPVAPDVEGLARLAEATGGQSYESRDADSVSAVYEQLGSFIGTRQVKEEVTAWPAGIAALLLALGGLAAWRLGPRLP
jgi:Ca-activated chloride channel family protein